MRRRRLIDQAIFSIAVLFLGCVTAGAQVVFKPRIPVNDPIIQAPKRQQDAPVIVKPQVPDSIVRERQAPQVPAGQRPQQGPPYIYPDSNPVKVKDGQTFNYATIFWDAGPDHPYAEVWVEVDGNKRKVIEQGKGYTGAKIELEKSYLYTLEDFGQVLDSTTITATRIITGPLPGGAIIRPNDRIENAMIAYVTDSYVKPNISDVEIGFFSASNASPIVEIGTTRPVQRNGQYIFAPGSSVGSGGAVPSRNIKKVGVKANTFHKFDTLLPGFPDLQPGTDYWYIVNGQVPGGYPSTFQSTGSFTTRSQTVRVVFEAIKITNSSDDDDFLPDGGEIDLWFWVNRGKPTERRFKIQNLNDNRAFTNHVYDLKHEFMITEVPNDLTLNVQAKEGDRFLGQDNDDSEYYPAGAMGPSKSENDEYNHALDRWDLKRFSTSPGETFRQPFKLVSMPNGGDKGNLSFEVTGYWEITRN